MVERTPMALADALEPMLREKLGDKRKRGASPITFKCVTTLEAAQLATELRQRGWSASATKAISLATSDVWIGVRVTGRKKVGAR
jgi:hypothetical protein